jgi:hypothetical protein
MRKWQVDHPPCTQNQEGTRNGRADQKESTRGSFSPSSPRIVDVASSRRTKERKNSFFMMAQGTRRHHHPVWPPACRFNLSLSSSPCLSPNGQEAKAASAFVTETSTLLDRGYEREKNAKKSKPRNRGAEMWVTSWGYKYKS